ncbi:hypothetical protein [Nocardia sp. NPDC051570]|uniref:hypothetical protein n=1 Tax=Nocardia sp. NPDC051570 TaxID=3364324 RepID=UPI0037A51047
MTNHPTDMWSLIDAAAARAPLTAATLNDLLGVSLSPESGRQTAGPARLGSKFTVQQVGTVSRPDGAWVFSYFDFDTPPCVGLDEVKGRHPDIVRTAIPSGHSLEEKFVWSSKRPWGVLNFGFRERDYCLVTVSLHSPGDWG